MQGLDLSFWQKDTYKTYIDNYAKSFVIARATFGRTVDSCCDKIYQYAKSKGKLLGFYMFPLTSEGDARASAEWHYAQVKGYIGEAIPCVDWEATNGTDVSNVEWAYQFLTRFKELSGVKPLIYMNSSCEASYDWSKVVKGDFGLWIANYGSNDGKDHGVPSLKHWPFWAIHQFTSMYGGQSLDANVFQGDSNAWKAYAGAKAKPAPAPKKKSVDEIAQEVIKGKWGNGEDRKKRLTKAGYDYNAVQKKVNEILAPKPTYKTYTVKAGDNLSSIAAKYGTTWQKIYNDNKSVIGGDPGKIYPGQVLKIY